MSLFSVRFLRFENLPFVNYEKSLTFLIALFFLFYFTVESTSYSDSRPSSGYSEQYNASLTNELAQERSLREAAEADRDKYQERQKVTQSELDRTKRELRELKEQLGKLKEEGR